MVLFRIVDIGAELFAMTASGVRANMLARKGQDGAQAVLLADHFCRLSRQRVEQLFERIFHNNDQDTSELARQVLEGKHEWLESGIVDLRKKENQVPRVVPEPVRLSR